MVNVVALLTPELYFVAIILATWIVARVMTSITGRVMSSSTPAVTVQTRRAVKLLVWSVGAILGLGVLGFNTEILTVIVALLGAGVIMTFRKPLENMGSKYFTDVYVPFRLGDSVSVGGHTGKVIEMNSISVVILDAENRLVSVPNTVFMEREVVNVTPRAWKELVIPVTVGNEVDLATFESEVMKSLDKLWLHLDKRFPPVLTTKSKGAQSTELTVLVYIQSPEERDMMLAEVNKRITETINSIRKAK
ncbi:MAG: mechanosensitive ion channel [Nitrososphaerota archaeon]|nr:mechanosensitive ion channel [Nitrososphaerota archaeon]MDG7027921.1 mechanosensitive ion channel [Nitrososphaerota archaeon]MDG7030741.1 mechanosensitive ion channel [Nitrososphaerota archaeon]